MKNNTIKKREKSKKSKKREKREKSKKSEKRETTKTRKNKNQNQIQTVCSQKLQFNSFEKVKVDNTDYQQQLIKILNTPFSPSKITAQSDYYSYINYIWLKNTEKSIGERKKNQKYFVQIDDFRITQDKVYVQLIDIVKEYIKKEDSTKAKMIENVYLSLLNLNDKPIRKHVAELVELSNYYYNYSKTSEKYNSLIWELLAHINQSEVVSFKCPLYWRVMEDQKNSKKFVDYISFPELALYDYNLYLDDEGQTKEFIMYKHYIKREYIAFSNKLFHIYLGKDTIHTGQDVFDVEYELLSAMGCNSIKKDDPDFYNVVQGDEALEKYGFDWHQFCKYLGYKTPPKTFICDSLNYLKCVCTLLNKDWNTKKWQSYWYGMHLRQLVRFDKQNRHVYFDFYGKIIQGQQEMFPRDIFPVFGLSLTFNKFLTDEYVAKYKNDVAVNYVQTLGKDLITVFKRIVHRNTWLSEKTKKYALLKLDHLKLTVGKPDHVRDDPILDYTPDDAWQNLLILCKWKTKQSINLSGKEAIDIPKIDWHSLKLTGQQSYIVNAFYTPTLNSIYVPLAYIQKPFVDLGERGIEYDLARVGFTLAHEMSHCLDDMGSKYDYNGNLHNWWNKEDSRKFKLIIKDIIKQYEQFASYDGIKFDASIGVGEDMADISGLSICTEYLADFQKKNEDIIPIKSLSFQALYVYFAMQQREHIYKQAIKSQLKTNPHPLDKYRTNVPLSRISLFRSLYNIKKGDKMWWHSTNTIW